MLGELGIRRALPVHLPFLVPAKGLHGIANLALSRLVFLCHARPAAKFVDLRRLLQGESVHEGNDGAFALLQSRGNTCEIIPGGLPVHKGPEPRMAHESPVGQVIFKVGQDAVAIRPVGPEHACISRVKIIFPYHENVMEGEGGNHLQIGRGILAWQQAPGQDGPVEILQGLAGHLGIVAQGQMEQYLQAGVHDVLQLLIVRAVHVGGEHAILQRFRAHAPQVVHPGGGGGNVAILRQGITRAAEGGQMQRRPLIACG